MLISKKKIIRKNKDTPVMITREKVNIKIFKLIRDKNHLDPFQT